MRNPQTFKAEAFDVMQYFYRTAHDPLVRACIRLDGRIDEGALKRAVALSARAVPQIFCRFNDSGRRARWAAAGYTAEQAVQIVKVNDRAEDFPERLLASSSVDIFREPQVKLIVLRGEASDTLCVLMSHLVCDGGGFKEYLYLLCALYGKCRENPSYDEDLKPRPRGLRQLYARFSLPDKLRILSAKDELGKQKNNLRVCMQGDADSPFIAKRVLPRDSFDAARANAKALGATANDLLLAAYARALQRETGVTRVTIPCPVDLRKYLPAGRQYFFNLTGNLFCEVEIEPGEPFEATLRKTTASMAVQKDSVACLKGPMLYGMLYPVLSLRWMGKNFSKLFTIPVTSTTNLGILDAGRLKFAGAGVSDAYLTAAIKRAPYFQVTASTFEGSCTLTCNLFGTPRDRDKTEQFLDGMVNELVGEGNNI